MGVGSPIVTQRPIIQGWTCYSGKNEIRGSKVAEQLTIADVKEVLNIVPYFLGEFLEFILRSFEAEASSPKVVVETTFSTANSNASNS